jgi:hypothetical protein
MKRRALKVVVALLLGAICTFAVASFPSFTPLLLELTDFRAAWLLDVDATSSELQRDRADELWSHAAELHSTWPAEFETAYTAVSVWGSSEVVHSTPIGVSGGHLVGYYRTGWPFYALDTYDFMEPGRRWSSNMFEYHIYRGPASLPLVFPYGVIWPGFAANTIFFAIGIAGSRWLYVGARNRRRIRKGLCPMCRYQLQGFEGCPECGWRREAKPT